MDILSHRELLYRVFDAMDGNFSMQLYNKGVSETEDPCMYGDRAYYVEKKKTDDYLKAVEGADFDKLVPNVSTDYSAGGGIRSPLGLSLPVRGLRVEPPWNAACPY